MERCDYLLTWNLRHIANIGIRREVERILVKHGYNGTLIYAAEHGYDLDRIFADLKRRERLSELPRFTETS